jgi:hypothetical protein
VDGKILKLILRKRWEGVDSIHLAQVNGRWTALCRRWWTSVFCEQRVVCVCVSYLSVSRTTILPVVSIFFSCFQSALCLFLPRYFFLIRPVFSLSLLALYCPNEKSLLFILHLRYSSRFSAARNRLGRKRGTLAEIYCHTPECHLTPRILGVGGCEGLFMSIRRMRHSLGILWGWKLGISLKRTVALL